MWIQADRVRLKGQCPHYEHARASFVFSSKDNRTVILTRQDFLPDRTADGDLLFTFSSNILDFQRHEGRLATRKFRSARFKNSFSNVKLVSEVNCSKSSSIHMICSRSSLKRLKDINKSAIPTLWIIAKVSQKSYYDSMALIFLNM